MTNNKWQTDVSTKLGALVQQTADMKEQFATELNGVADRFAAEFQAVAEQVRRQNGNVARIQGEIGELKQHTPMACPLGERIGAVELAIATDRAGTVAADKATSSWRVWAERGVVFVLGILFIMALKHGDEVLKAINVFKAG